MLQIWRVSQWSQLYPTGLGRVSWGIYATCNPKFDTKWLFAVRITLGRIIASYIWKKCLYFSVNVTSLSFYWLSNIDHRVHLPFFLFWGSRMASAIHHALSHWPMLLWHIMDYNSLSSCMNTAQNVNTILSQKCYPQAEVRRFPWDRV